MLYVLHNMYSVLSSYCVLILSSGDLKFPQYLYEGKRCCASWTKESFSHLIPRAKICEERSFLFYIFNQSKNTQHIHHPQLTRVLLRNGMGAFSRNTATPDNDDNVEMNERITRTIHLSHVLTISLHLRRRCCCSMKVSCVFFARSFSPSLLCYRNISKAKAAKQHMRNEKRRSWESQKEKKNCWNRKKYWN